MSPIAAPHRPSPPLWQTAPPPAGSPPSTALPPSFVHLASAATVGLAAANVFFEGGSCTLSPLVAAAAPWVSPTVSRTVIAAANSAAFVLACRLGIGRPLPLAAAHLTTCALATSSALLLVFVCRGAQAVGLLGFPHPCETAVATHAQGVMAPRDLAPSLGRWVGRLAGVAQISALLACLVGLGRLVHVTSVASRGRRPRGGGQPAAQGPAGPHADTAMAAPTGGRQPPRVSAGPRPIGAPSSHRDAVRAGTGHGNLSGGAAPSAAPEAGRPRQAVPFSAPAGARKRGPPGDAAPGDAGAAAWTSLFEAIGRVATTAGPAEASRDPEEVRRVWTAIEALVGAEAVARAPPMCPRLIDGWGALVARAKRKPRGRLARALALPAGQALAQALGAEPPGPAGAAG